MTHNRPLREVAQTTRRSRSQPPHFRQRAACARRPGRGAVSAVCVCVSRCETARINERANTLSGPSDKCGADHSYAFVPDGAVNGEGRDGFQMTLKAKTLGLAFMLWLCCVFSSSDADSHREGREEEDLSGMPRIPLGKKPTRLGVAFWLLAPRKVCRDCLCCCVLWLLT